MLRNIVAGWCVAMVALVGCAAPDSSSDDTSSISVAEPETTTSTRSSATSASTTTATTTTTSLTTTTTTRPVVTGPVFDDPTSWLGIEFETTTDDPYLEGVEILANVDYADLLLLGEPAGVYPWYVGETANAFDGPTFYALIVGDTPHPYKVSELEMEAGGVPAEPIPGDTHQLLIWAISATSPTTYEVTDVITAELDATLLIGNSMRSILMESYACDLDTSVRHGAPFAFFVDSEDLEIEKLYPAEYAFVVYDGSVQEVAGDNIRCVVRFDPENY